MSESTTHTFMKSLTAIGKHMLQAVAAVGMLLLPKCGLCLAAYLNLFSILGISLRFFAPWVAPLLGVILVLGLVVSFLKSRKQENYLTFYVSLAGSLLVTAGRLWELGMSFTWVGLAIIATGSIIQLVIGRTTCSRSL